MFKHGKQIDGYRLQQTEKSVIIDERENLTGRIVRIVMGLSFMLFPGAVILHMMFYNGLPNYSHATIGDWLILLFLFCVIFFFAYEGFLCAFEREYVEVTGEKILKGNTWFGVPVKLKAMPVSELIAIKLAWEDQGHFAWNWQCVASTLSAKKKKTVALFSCSKKEATLELVNAIAEMTKLPVQDVPQS